MRVAGKVAIITGASSGFGKALAWRLTGKGGKVVLGDISEAAGKALEKELNAKHPGSAVFAVCDVTKKSDQERLFELAKSKFGSIDIVVNNAGIGEGTSFAQDTQDSWIKVLRIDLEAVILGTRLAISEMIKAGKGGVILNTASLAGLYPQPFQPVYAAAKGGVVHFTRSLGHLAQTHGIYCNAICPSFSPTGILEAGEKQFGEEFKKYTEKRVPVELVIDAFVRGIEDENLAGACIRITPELGIDIYNWRRTKAKI
ncbi:uncharacterized protein SPPG_08296 [Spizellomyces punctatus DAOM BR117]|uniref:Uncharacterized protein n=1 Tax=Spizellomyces punctatus (strain DAOM BR117) TaxID=645134 RepID=A0A0L0H595_SPIPD|nr:uncharacterized protein SPPG_08296 [Spizellomyces punctatus DAOM BR117]KNC96397.1 hypothetical protein SPPG_08296 [Spizellomyces punctatus DAOM BR117]|eukprot:XP_016604437.1 hypothetical protein SPPG_08296 [Spizellomyces punctatus DAOM BR117]